MQLLTDFIFETFEEAINVHRKLFELGRKKHFVTYADLYKMTNKVEDDKVLPDIYENHGWTNLWHIKLEPYDKTRWILRLPEIKLIKKEVV